MTDVMTVRAGCDACALTMTAVVVDDTIPADVADFFRVHAAHLATQPGTGTRPHGSATAARAPWRLRISRRLLGNS